MGGANQQERLYDSEEARWFLAGFIEGEGSLTVSVKAHPTAKFGFYVDPEFFLYQHVSGQRLLEFAQYVFHTGRIFPKPGNPNVLTFAVTDRRSMTEQVVPFFEKYVVPFSCKAATFECFKEILDKMNRKEHHDPQGLVQIVEIAYRMNPASKGRERLRPIEVVRDRILRDYTQNTRKDG